jgi:tetratricopeptide (TPR) repeat protein
MPSFSSLEELREYLRELQSRGEYLAMIDTATAALADLEESGGRNAEYGTVLMLRANARLLNCDYPGAEVEYQACCALFAELNLPIQQAQCRLRVARCAMWLMDLPRARQLVETVLSELPSDAGPGLRGEATEVLGRIAMRQHDLPAAIEQLYNAQELYFAAEKQYQAFVTMNNLALACIEAGDFDRAGKLLDDCYFGLIQIGEYRRAWDAKISRATLLARLGQVDLARLILRDCLPDIERYADFTSQYRLYYQLAVLEILAGNQLELDRVLHQLLTAPQTNSIPGAQGSIQLLLAINLILRAELPGAEEMLHQAQQTLRSDDHPGRSLLVALEAVLLARKGDLAGAVQSWNAGMVEAISNGEVQNAALVEKLLSQQIQLERTWLVLPPGAHSLFERWRADLAAVAKLPSR